MPPALDGTSAADRCFGCNYGIYPLPHLPTLSMATLLRDNGFSVAIHDFASKKTSVDEFRQFILKDDADICIFFSVFLSGKTDTLAREMIRNCRTSIRFIFTGTQPTSCPDQFLDMNDSYVIRGEPEFILLNLLQNFSAGKDATGINGVSWIKNNSIIENGSAGIIEDLDTLPIPDRTLLDHTPYYNPKLSRTPHTAILTSRGCFGKCWYCVPNSLSFSRELEFKRFSGKKPIPRLHSVRRVIDEFQIIHSQGFKSVTVLDDEFLWNEERTIAICNGIREFKLEWLCLARPDMITDQSVTAMAEAGCRYIDLGIESFSQSILNDVGKNISVGCARNAIATIKKYGIEPKVNILFGASPLETEETIRNTIDIAESLGVRYVLYNVAAPFPGTDFYTAARANHWFVTPDNDYHPLDPSAEAIIEYPHLSQKRLEYFLSYAYRRHYFNIGYLLSQIRSVQSFSDFWNKLGAAGRIFKRHFMLFHDHK